MKVIFTVAYLIIAKMKLKLCERKYGLNFNKRKSYFTAEFVTAVLTVMYTAVGIMTTTVPFLLKVI